MRFWLSLNQSGQLLPRINWPSRPNAKFVNNSQMREHHAFLPNIKRTKKQKGRVPVRTGGSTKGTTVIYGGLGLRLCDKSIRYSAKQLILAERVLRRKLPKGSKTYTRINCSIPVYTKGNESRMGRGKGTFEFWAVRVPVSKVLFEVDPSVRPEVAKKALNCAARKLPGVYECIDKNSWPKMGLLEVDPNVANRG